jgi:hypothetical protein
MISLVRGIALPVLCALASVPALAAPPSARLLLPDFSALGSTATDSVAITLDAPLLAVAAKFLDSADPEQRSVRDMIGGLQGIYVKSYSFDKPFAYPATDVDAIRKQLRAPGWQQIVQVRSGAKQSAVDIFVCLVHEKPIGLALIATEPRQFTIVNIVGSIDLDKLHQLEGRFGVPKLPAEAKGPPSSSSAN